MVTEFGDRVDTFWVQDFQKLSVWQRGDALGLRVDVVVRRFPRQGYAPLRAQLSRAADSIAATIVEGCGAATKNADGAHFCAPSNISLTTQDSLSPLQILFG
jgi:hypothetical protein